MDNRDAQILCGLFLSKFGEDALSYFGFGTYSEAFNVLGYGLGARPASINNYRDELDPYFPNPRKGWHGRSLREHCKRVFENYSGASLEDIGGAILSFLDPAQAIMASPRVSEVIQRHRTEATSSFAKRMATGRAAERYFAANFGKMPEFSEREMQDTTEWGCGFDFKLTDRNGASGVSYHAVEVKGLRAKNGTIQLTGLEYEMAEALGEDYFLVVVRNFMERPFHTIFRNPLDSDLTLSKSIREETRISWSTNIAG